MKAKDIIKLLDLRPLEPEGGFFRETLRSSSSLDTGQIGKHPNRKRSLYTAIYYLLTDEDVSKPHRLNSDEIWLFHFGDPVEMKVISPDGVETSFILGSNIMNNQHPQILVPAGWVQSAKIAHPKEGFALVSTIVVPGFDSEDFELVE